MDMDDHMAVAEQAQNGIRPDAIVLPVEQAQAIVNYLQNCRYAEVHDLIGYLLSAAKQETT